MHAALGILFHFIGGFVSGSFYIPYQIEKQWSRESYWLVGGIFFWLIVPPIAAFLTIPEFAAIIIPLGISTIIASVVFVGYGNSL